MPTHSSIPPGPSSLGTPHTRVAVIDDEPTARRLMTFWLGGAGYEVCEASTLAEARSLHDFDVACVDLGLGTESGIELIRHFHSIDPQLPCIVVTAAREIETAVQAMRAGAYDYVTKPLESGRLLQAVGRAKERRDLQRSVQRLENELAERRLVGAMAGQSEAMREVEMQIERVVERDVPVCLLGERGSGRELVARAIHQGSARSAGPFIRVDCVAAGGEDDVLIFGREAADGSITAGALEQASGGTLFLENVDALSPSTQSLLSGVLVGRSSRRVGSSDTFSVNSRVMASSSSNLRQLCDEGLFNEELFFRLMVCPISVPALRERVSDIPVIVGHFLQSLADGTPTKHVAPSALDLLVRYPWPGNLPELRNIIHRALLVSVEDGIRPIDLPAEVRGAPTNDNADARWLVFPENEVIPLREIERKAIEHALRVTRGSVSAAAQKLGIGRATLYRRLASFEQTLPQGGLAGLSSEETEVA
ncbi:MAG: sigma-54 dependent transcriptional regulator [Polyangiaceae bacterium]|nr:sigma-54 dependent transcriptional regulator [Polyangiaceae bacterium]